MMMMMMKQILLNIFVFISILTHCTSQRLIYHCDFDTGLTNNCSFSKTPGAPSIDTSFGATSINSPTQPLSDVKSITSPTTPNNELCVLPQTYLPETWPTYFCRQNSVSNYTCQTKSGTGNCIIGQYGLVKTTVNGLFAELYTSVNTVQNHVDTSQCLDFYYYLTDRSFNALISVGWSGSSDSNIITEVRATTENKWQRYQITYPTPSVSNYYISFQMVRDGGSAGFSFALDEIKIFDGPCELLTTIDPDITVSTIQTTSIIETDSSSLTHEISTNKFDITSSESLPVTDISTDSLTNKQTVDNTDHTTLISFSSTTPTTTQLVFTGTDSISANTNTNSEIYTASSFLTTTHETLIPTTTISTDEITISDTTITTTKPTNEFTTTLMTSTTPFITSTKKPNLSLILGLALGIGFPVILLSIGGLVYYNKMVKPKRRVLVHTYDEDEIPMT